MQEGAASRLAIKGEYSLEPYMEWKVERLYAYLKKQKEREKTSPDERGEKEKERKAGGGEKKERGRVPEGRRPRSVALFAMLNTPHMCLF